MDHNHPTEMNMVVVVVVVATEIEDATIAIEMTIDEMTDQAQVLMVIRT